MNNSIKTLFLFLIISSCNLIEKEKNQVFPDYDYSLVNEIKILDKNSDYNEVITDKNLINSLVLFFKDSSNYFKNDRISLFDSSKHLFILELKANKGNINFTLSPTKNPHKIEVGYFNQKKFKENPNAYREYHRFYIDYKIIDLIKKIKDN